VAVPFFLWSSSDSREACAFSTRSTVLNKQLCWTEQLALSDNY
jgi:hypothetical protein